MATLKESVDKLGRVLTGITEASLKKEYPAVAEAMQLNPLLAESGNKKEIVRAIQEAVRKIPDASDGAASAQYLSQFFEKNGTKESQHIPLRESIMVSANQAVRSGVSSRERDALVESLSQTLANGKSDKKLRESTRRLIESKIGRSKWSFPISRVDHINVNFRRYSKPLWERVINEQKHIWEGNVGLADHPPGDADPQFKHSAVVWSNMRMDEANKLVWADAIFVGETGRLAEDILEAGGKVGFSTAGLGDLERVTENIDGQFREFYEVVPSEFILERVADVVPNPSQDVFGILDMKVAEAAGQDYAAAQKSEPIPGDVRTANTTEQRPSPVEGEEADLPEFSETDPLPTASTDTWESGDTSSLEEGAATSRDRKRVNEDDGGGDGGDAGAGVSASAADFQGEAPENVVTVTDPGRRKESDKTMKTKENTPAMSAYEQRRAREDINQFLEKAAKLDSPKDRLREYREIATYVDEIGFADVKKQVQEKIQSTKTELEQMLEKGSEFTAVFGTDLSAADVKSAVTSLSSVKENLEGQSYDWKQVSTRMAEQLKRFVEAVDVLKDRPTQASYAALRTRSKRVQESLERQIRSTRKKSGEKVQQLEKDLTKAYDAMRGYVKESKQRERALQEKVKRLTEANRSLKEQTKQLQEKATSVAHDFMRDDVKYLMESGRGSKQETEAYRAKNRSITESANTTRRSQGKAEVQEYYDSLLRKHGSAILPYSKQILEAKSYREAVDTFMDIMDDRAGFDPQAILDMENPIIADLMGGM